MPELEAIVRGARPAWPDPPAELEARILSAAGATGRAPSSTEWLRRAPRSRRVRLLAVAVLLVGSGAALAVALVGRSGPASAGEAASLDFGRPEIVARERTFLDVGAGIAVDSGGTVTAVWGRAGRIVAATRPREGRWSGATRLSDPSRPAVRPQVAAAADGQAVVVWRERTPGRLVRKEFRLPGGASAGVLDTRVGIRWRLMARTREEAGGWGPAEAVSPSTGSRRYVYAPRVVMTGAGEALAGYVLDGRVWVVRRPPGGDWGEPVAISPAAGPAFELRLVVDARSGFALATWLVRTDDPRLGRRWRAWRAVRSPDGRWDEAQPLGELSQGTPLVSSAINGRGEAVVAWSATALAATIRDASGSWSAPAALVGPPAGELFVVAGPAAGIDQRGRALVVSFRAERTLLIRKEPGQDWTSSPAGGPTPTDGAVVTDSAGGLVVALARVRPSEVVLEGFGSDGARRGRTRLRGFWAPLLLGVGADGTTAIARTRTRADGADLLVAVAPGAAGP